MFLNSKLKIFGCVALLYSSIYPILIYQNRLPVCHDTFQYLQLQYVYFNEVVQNHSLPLWFPFVNQGFVGNYYFTPQLTLLSPLFYFLGIFVGKINYLYLFYFAVWFEELFFLLGVILLSSLYYKNAKTVFFVSVTLMGTAIWYPQIWWNFHLYYFVPIVLYCVHKCFITRLFRYLILAILFFSLAVYGNFVYCGVFVSFVVLVYILLIAPVYFSEIKTFLRKNTRLGCILVLSVFITIMLLSFFYIKYTDNEITYSSDTREASGENTLKTFLTYGGSRGFGKFKEIFRRYDKTVDINLFVGFFLPAFVLISFLHCRKKLSYVVGAVALVIFLFSSGTFVSHIFYYLYPLGKVFRHIGLTATVFKLFIVFYAGFGFEIFIESLSNDKKPNFTKPIVVIILICMAIMAHTQVFKPHIALNVLSLISKTDVTFFLLLPYVILSMSFLLFWLKHKSIISRKSFINLILLLMVSDFFLYKYSLVNHRMPRVPDEAISLFMPYKYSFSEERLSETKAHLNSNDRMKRFNPVLGDAQKGAVYDTIDLFFFADSLVSSYRADYVLKPVREYHDFKKEFPGKKVTYEKYSGAGYPKLGVFSRLNLVDNETEMGGIFNLDSFTGDMLFTTSKEAEKIKDNLFSYLVQQQAAVDFKNYNERIAAKINVEKFSFNTLDLEVFVDGPENKYCFLYYADAYHPHWNAYVNGKKIPVIKSNIGYKSIMIPYGTSKVIFEFGNIFYNVSFFCTILMSLFILIAIIYVFVTEMFIHVRNPVLSKINDLSTESWQEK